MRTIVAMMAIVLGLTPEIFAQINVGSDGSDGALVVSANLTIDLSEAASGPGIAWDTPSPVPGKGVYDPDQWAVVFKYSSVTINANRTVTFVNHPSNAPVVWLVESKGKNFHKLLQGIATRFINESGTTRKEVFKLVGGRPWHLRYARTFQR